MTTTCTTGDCSYINTTDITAKLSWFGTLRGRVGPQWNGLWIYGTGGLAYGKVSVSGSNTVILIDNPDTVVGTYTTPFSFSKTKAGWTAGLGAAGVIAASRWTWKLEYIHIDLGSIGSASFAGVPSLTINVSKFTDDIVRFGLNYQLTALP